MPQAQHPPVPTSLYEGLWSSIRHSPPRVWDQLVGSNMYKERNKGGGSNSMEIKNNDGGVREREREREGCCL